jgi:hypothetical protein
MDSHESRNNQRKKFVYYMRAYDNKTQKPLGYLADISPKGFKLDCNQNVPAGTDFSIRLDLTNEVSNKTSMVFMARSKWCKPDSTDPFSFNVGFELVSISPEDAKVFQRIFELYGAKS